MAGARWRPSPGRQYGALNQLVGGFTEGYSTMADWVREHRAEEDRQLEREARDRMAQIGADFESGGYDVQQAIPGVQQYGTTPTGAPAVSTIGQPSREITTKDWERMRQDVFSAKMTSGDLAGAIAAQDAISAMQHRGAMQYGQEAMRLMQAGDLEGAAQALNQGNQYFPNGSRNVYQVMGGNLVMMGLDEESGQPRGAPVAVDQEYLTNVLTNFRDPEKFAAWTLDRRKLESTEEWRKAQADLGERRLDIAAKTLEAKLEANAIARGQKLDEKARKAANAAYKAGLSSDGVWDKMPPGDRALVERLGLDQASFAEMMGQIAADNSGLSTPEVYRATIRGLRDNLRERGEAGATGETPPTTAAAAIPTSREAVKSDVDQIKGLGTTAAQAAKGFGEVGKVVKGALNTAVSGLDPAKMRASARSTPERIQQEAREAAERRRRQAITARGQ